eukprot:5495245-Pyramimonas_sp.AAC.1
MDSEKSCPGGPLTILHRVLNPGLDLNAVIRYVFMLVFVLLDLLSCNSLPNPPEAKNMTQPKSNNTALRFSP